MNEKGCPKMEKGRKIIKIEKNSQEFKSIIERMNYADEMAAFKAVCSAIRTIADPILPECKIFGGRDSEMHKQLEKIADTMANELGKSLMTSLGYEPDAELAIMGERPSFEEFMKILAMGDLLEVLGGRR